ncbi:MAG: ATP-binding protein [Gammaproteobacteria bacterium]
MKRIYETLIENHFEHDQQMVFASGPRQAGKSTIAHQCCEKVALAKYLNWDKIIDREIILSGQAQVVSSLPINAILPSKPLIVFDEIHKYKNWKSYLKGFIDEYKGKLDILVTGSTKLNVFQRDGDSLAGRYFLYRIHPLSVAELLRTELPKEPFSLPEKIPDELFDNLFRYGGFPEPFIKQNLSFYNRWQLLRQQQILKEDIRELAQIQELAQLEVLASIIQNQAGQLIKYSNLSKKVRVAETTIRRWINVLESFYYCFTLKPWSTNVSRSLIKEPKIYLWDWSIVKEMGPRVENFVANHLYKACHFWTDMGFGHYELFFLRDKDQKEVDFLITENKKPWLLVEVKNSYKEPLSQNLTHFQKQLNAKHVLQVAFDLPFVEFDCFSLNTPKIVPIKTFLSQLI